CMDIGHRQNDELAALGRLFRRGHRRISEDEQRQRPALAALAKLPQAHQRRKFLQALTKIHNLRMSRSGLVIALLRDGSRQRLFRRVGSSDLCCQKQDQQREERNGAGVQETSLVHGDSLRSSKNASRKTTELPSIVPSYEGTSKKTTPLPFLRSRWMN